MRDRHDLKPDAPAPYLTDCEPIDWAEFERWARLSPGEIVPDWPVTRNLARPTAVVGYKRRALRLF